MSANRRSATSTGRRAVALVALLVCAPSFMAVAYARPIDAAPSAIEPEEIPTAQVAQRGRVSLQQAIAIATRQVKGRVVRAETTMRNGRTVHEIRILDEENVVRTVRIDAESGDVR